MNTAQFRFYEELNDFLPPDRRKREFVHACAERATVKHAIEALGVPHTEVELILVNGESVDFDRIVRPRDRVSVYPMFEALDITPLLRVRERPLRDPRFLADSHLGVLARYLRMLGFDTRDTAGMGDTEIVAAAVAEGRILLSRDRDLLMRRATTHGCYVRATAPRRQLREIVSRLDLARSIRPSSRCMACNTELEPVAREAVVDRSRPSTRGDHALFCRCGRCHRVCRAGAHHAKMRQLIEEVTSGQSDPASIHP